MASNLKMLQSNNLTAIDLIDAIRPKRSSLKRLNSKKSLTSSSGPSSPTKFDEKFNPSIILPSAKQIIYSLNKQSLLNDEHKLNLDAQQPQPFRPRMKSNSCFDILQNNQESSKFKSKVGSKFELKFEMKPPSEMKSTESKSTAKLKTSSQQEISFELNPFKKSSLSKNPSKTTISSSKSSNSDHNTSSGVCNVEHSSKNEECEYFDDSFSIASSGFAKNGGASQFGSGIDINTNFNISNKFSNLLFASALLKAEKKRRIEQWISGLSLECN